MEKRRSRRPVLGEILDAKLLLGIPSFVKARRRQGRKGAGLRYEAKVQSLFCEQYDHYVASPWFQYRTDLAPQRINYSQPDGLLIDVARGLITIVEIKLTHTPDAYFQLYDKYLPIVEKFFRGEVGERLWRFAVVEVTRWYDTAIAFPTNVTLREDITLVQPNEFGVHVCRPDEES